MGGEAVNGKRIGKRGQGIGLFIQIESRLKAAPTADRIEKLAFSFKVPAEKSVGTFFSSRIPKSHPEHST
jgi:hypothetical protein